jgi:hypothetical protein
MRLNMLVSPFVSVEPEEPFLHVLKVNTVSQENIGSSLFP